MIKLTRNIWKILIPVLLLAVGGGWYLVYLEMEVANQMADPSGPLPDRIFRLKRGEMILGVTLTDGLLMVPSKSVTAIIGLSRSGASVTSSCRNCSKPSCPYRKEF